MMGKAAPEGDVHHVGRPHDDGRGLPHEQRSEGSRPAAWRCFTSFSMTQGALGMTQEPLNVMQGALGMTQEPLNVMQGALGRAQEPLSVMQGALGRAQEPFNVMQGAFG
ncbi:MAG: hypothetical protein HPY83_09170 [Anaerolineae bacterium]|nr:hypothetical protein [Anaerolineae bacterium]